MLDILLKYLKREKEKALKAVLYSCSALCAVPGATYMLAIEGGGSK